MSDWGTSNTAAAAPKFVTGMAAAGYGNTFNVDVVAFTPAAAGAANLGTVHTGWVYNKVGTGSIVSFTITSGGTAYANTDTWSAGNAAGTVVTNGSGVITALNITDAGSGFTANSAVTITTATGSGASITAVAGGKAGRVQKETLVATATMSAS